MSDTREILRRALGESAPAPDARERVLRRLERRRRNKRITAGAVAAAIVVIGSLAFLRVVVSAEPVPMDEPVGNGKIAYSDQDPDGSSFNDQIVIVEPDGSGRVQLTSGAPSDYPAWSPDGTQIAYVQGATSLFIMNADGSDQSLVQGPITERSYHFFRPSWSPDGTQLVFAEGATREDRHEPSYKLYVVNIDGSGLTKITRGRHSDWWPSWSPDGTLIAFRTGPGRHLATMSPDGSNRTRLVPGPIDYPSWSPDGQIYFVKRPAGGGSDVFRINSDGTGLARTTESPGKWEFFPVSSPDGTQIAFRRPAKGPGSYIFTESIDGTESPVRVTQVAWVEAPLSWQPT